MGIHLTGQGCSRFFSGVKVEGSASANELETWGSKSQGPNTWVSSRGVTVYGLIMLSFVSRSSSRRLNPNVFLCL